MSTRPVLRSYAKKFVSGVQLKAARGVTKGLILGASEASVLTPIDTSFLLNSQYRRLDQRGDFISGQVGYTANYAIPVHDPAVLQNFHRPTAEKEFLRKGFERAEPSIRTVVSQEIKS